MREFLRINGNHASQKSLWSRAFTSGGSALINVTFFLLLSLALIVHANGRGEEAGRINKPAISTLP